MNMETKSAAVEIKTNSTPGEFTAVISAIGNDDRQGDRAMPGCMAKAMSEDPIPPVYWAHQHLIPPIGDGVEWFEQGQKEIVYKGALFVKGDDEHQYAKMVYAGMKSRDGRPPAINQFSYTYGVPEGGAERVLEGGKSIRLLHEIRPVAEVGPCFMGANPDTYLIDPAKSFHGGDPVGQLVAARKNIGRRGVSMKQLLAETLDMKDYGDIDGWEIRMLLEMIDGAVSFIQYSNEDDDIVQMQTIATTLVGMLSDEFAEVTGLIAQGDAIQQIIDGDPAAIVEVDVTLVSASAEAEAAGLDKKDEKTAAVVVPETPAAVADEVVETPADTPAEAAVPAEEAPAEVAADAAEAPAEESQDMTSDEASTVSDEDIARLLLAVPSH